ncbi:MAG: hypothetical protein WKF34_10025 [Pyrinomonadaceae bacterium]
MEKKNLRVLYYILIVVFIVVGAIRLYSWSQRRDDIAGAFTSFGFATLFLSITIGQERRPLYYGLLGLSIVLIVLSIILMIANWPA